jgi:hypothetical protein
MTTDKSADDAVLDDVFSSERDRGGKSAPPEAASTERPAEPQGQQPQEPAPTQEPQAQDPETGRMVPLAELLAERKKGKEKVSEAERRAIEAEARARVFEQQLQAPRQQPQPQRQQVRIPDPVAEPEEYARFVHQSTQHAVFEERLHASEERARDKHGDDLVNEAFQAANAAGLIGPQSPFFQYRHPWGEMVEWHKKQKVLAEVGTDPQAFRQKVEQEARAKVLAELKAGNGPTAQGQPQRFPGTLAEATASGKQGAHLTDEAAMGSVFSTNRDRRK